MHTCNRSPGRLGLGCLGRDPLKPQTAKGPGTFRNPHCTISWILASRQASESLPLGETLSHCEANMKGSSPFQLGCSSLDKVVRFCPHPLLLPSPVCLPLCRLLSSEDSDHWPFFTEFFAAAELRRALQRGRDCDRCSPASLYSRAMF